MNLLDGEPTSQLLRYVYSSDLDTPFKIKVGTLEGDPPRPNYHDIIDDPLLRRNLLRVRAPGSGTMLSGKPGFLSDLVVTVEIFSDGRSLAMPTQTSFKPFTIRYNWNEWLTLPLKFSDLPRDAQLAFTIWEMHGPKQIVAVGGTTLSIFNKSGAMRQGMHDLKVWANTQADGSGQTSTPGKISDTSDELARLIKLTKKHRNGEMPRVDWLDRLTFREIEVINDEEKKRLQQMFLMIEFPRVVYRDIEHMVVYFEKDLDAPCYSTSSSHSQLYTSNAKLATMFDPDVWQENLVEDKHHKLLRNQRTQLIDKDLKPNATIRDQLNRILNKCSTMPLTADEQDLIWKFRFYLKDQKKALAKFVHCVKWNAQMETLQALELMMQWEPMDVEDALELLGPQFTHTAVRRYAVTRLEQASDEDLLLYLLQLVQALKYEPAAQCSLQYDQTPLSASGYIGSVVQTGISPHPANNPVYISEQPTVAVLATAAGESPAVDDIASTEEAIALDEESRLLEDHESETTTSVVKGERLTQGAVGRGFSGGGGGKRHRGEPAVGTAVSSHRIYPLPAAQHQLHDDSSIASNSGSTSHTTGSVGGSTLLDDHTRDLASFLIRRASRSDVLANYLYWYLTVESEGSTESAARNKDTNSALGNATHADMYANVLRRLVLCLKNGNREQDLRRKMLAKQLAFVKNLVNLMKTVAAESGNRQKKIEKLKSLLSDPEQSKLTFPDGLALPLNPKIRVKAIVPGQATLFKSALMPCRLTFLTDVGEEYVAIFKHGDDLRQDQLILQIITLMDRLLRRENLDLKLTPYCVLATSTRHGFVEYVESRTVADVLKEEGSIQNYFRKCAPCESAAYGIAPEVMDNYVKSCAGYCVITYLLGVGDRHLDNLLLTRRGQLFHIDFGYILGRDPKPLPPPMKLSREMVEAMGGVQSEHYHEFKKQSYTSFLHLRRHANLILNLFSLMVDASVPDIALEPDKTAKKVQDKFLLDLSDEEAVSEMQRLIDSSVSAVMAVVVESLHKWAQYWRK